MRFDNLENCDFDKLYRGFERAFRDYEIHFEKSEVRSMLERRGYNPRLSFAAFDNEEIVAFTLNGTGVYNGIPTAYDTGTGTAKEYRGQGLAVKIFNHSVPALKASGIEQYLLEVMQNNNKAISVYSRMNFRITREFDCFRQSVTNIIIPPAQVAPCAIESVSADCIRQAQDFCDFCPSWQNGIDSIERGESALQCLGAFVSEALAGFCVLDAETGDLAQIAVANDCRRRGIATGLLREAVSRMNCGAVKVLNVDAGNSSLPLFLESRNILLSGKQYEMILKL